MTKTDRAGEIETKQMRRIKAHNYIDIIFTLTYTALSRPMFETNRRVVNRSNMEGDYDENTDSSQSHGETLTEEEKDRPLPGPRRRPRSSAVCGQSASAPAHPHTTYTFLERRETREPC